MKRKFWLVIAACAVALMVGTTSMMGDTFSNWQRQPATAASQSTGNGPDTSRHVVALGDSVTSGDDCDCVPFPQVYGQDLAEVRGWSTSVDNLGKGGMDSTGLLDQLGSSGSDFDVAVADADIVLVTIGANDFSASHSAVTRGDCVEDGNIECVHDELSKLGKNVSAILSRIQELQAGRSSAVLVTGYWNVFEDGDVARSQYPGPGLKASHELTRRVNAVLRKTAQASHSTYVDLYAPFSGPVSRGDTTNLLTPDGDHPNAAGHALIARRLVVAGLPGLVSK